MTIAFVVHVAWHMVGKQLIHVEGTDIGVNSHLPKPGSLPILHNRVEMLVFPHLSLEDNPPFISVFLKLIMYL